MFIFANDGRKTLNEENRTSSDDKHLAGTIVRGPLQMVNWGRVGGEELCIARLVETEIIER